MLRRDIDPSGQQGTVDQDFALPSDETEAGCPRPCR
jgi:hypothetical protein